MVARTARKAQTTRTKTEGKAAPPAAPPATPDPTFQRVRSRRIFEEIAEQIRAQLSAGVFKPGDKLPPERTLADQFKVGRNAVREALRTLEIAGIVILKKGAKGGAFIREGDPNVVANTMGDLLRLGSISLAQLTEARLWIQSISTRVAVERATDEDIAKLEANVQEAERLFLAGEFERKAHVNIEFHILLAQATHNPVFVPIVASLMETMRHFVNRIGPERQKATLQSRHRLLQYIKERDSDRAVAEMESHLLRLEDRYREIGRNWAGGKAAQRGRRSTK